MKDIDNSLSWVPIALVSAGVSLVVSVGVLLLTGAASTTSHTDSSNEAATTTMGQLFSYDSSEGHSPVVQVAQAASPSVVSIVVTKDVPVIESYIMPNPFGLQPRGWRQDTREREIAGGSGFFVSDDGLIITNRHVVSDTEASYTALTNDGETYELEVVGRDPFLDVAVLRTRSGDNFPALSFGNSENLQLGESVVAIGNALGELRNSVSAGVISGISRSVLAADASGEMEQLDQVIQTDAAINPGNSGGPLLNLSGEVVGVNVAMAVESQNISFALPSNSVQEIVDSVREHGDIVRPFLGVRYASISDDMARMRNLPVKEGALVVEGEPGAPAVTPGSAAAEAGIQSGDIITALGETQVTSEMTLGEIIRQYEPGDTVTLSFLRSGEKLEMRVTLQEVPDQID